MKKEPIELTAKDWIAERRLKGKGDPMGHVACSDCGKLCDPDQMSTFGYWKKNVLLGYMAGVGIPVERKTYEEVIPGKKPKHTYSFVKDLCPSCATRLRIINGTYVQKMKIIGIVFLAFLLFVILLKFIFG